MRHLWSSRLVLLALCGCRAIFGNSDPGDEISAAGNTVQIANAVASPTTISCGVGSSNVYVNVTMVNTTSEDVTVTKAASSGVVLRASSDSVVGRQVYMLPSIPFSPAVPVIRAHDGNVVVQVIVASACPVFSPFVSFADIQVTLYITTNSGQYTTFPVTIRHTYQ